jgi:aminoglycoside phosphotransferase (APT) family kinase protein
MTALLDIAALARALAPRLPGDWERLELSPFVGGQSNPTFRLAAGDALYVLRKKPKGVLLPSAHAIDREFRILSSLAASGLALPKVHLYCDDATVIGTPFYVMEYLDGRVFRDPRLPDLGSGDRAAVYDEMNGAVAALHDIDFAANGLADLGRAENYLRRQIERWTKQYRATETRVLPAMELLIEWLPANLPADAATTLVHGDFRLENLIFHPAEPRLLGIVDWELATIGHPLADLAYNCLPYHLPAAAFGGLRDEALATGIPGEADYLKRYCARTGRTAIDDWGFYLAFALFRLAAILQGVLKRALDGNAASPDGLARGRLGEVCAVAALPLIGGPPSVVGVTAM